MNPAQSATPWKQWTLAALAALGLAASSASAQSTFEVGGAANIADEVLTSNALPVSGSNWTAPGGDGGNKFSHLASPAVVVANTGAVTLTFTHRYDFETNFDGGVVYVNVNDAGIVKVPLASFSSNGYDAAITGNSVWPSGEEVFNGTSAGYATPALVTSVADLGTLNATDTVAVEFRGGWDDNTNGASPNWEIATVAIADTGATLLDADFTADGPSGFVASTSGPGTPSSPWSYATATSRFEIDADLLTSDRYAPNAPGDVIDLNGANIEVALLAGTLDINDSFQLFDLSGGTTLTGSIDTLTLPGGQWDTSTFETDGTITCVDTASPLVYEPFNDLDPNLQGNTPGLGLPGVWESSPASSVAPESLNYGGIATQGGRMTSNLGGSNFQKSEISSQTLIDEGLLNDGATVWFSVIMVKHPVGANSNRRTYFSLGTGPPDGFDRIRTGPDTGDNGSGFTVVVNKVGDTGVTAQAWNDGSDGAGGATRGATDQSVTDGDTFLAVGKITWGAFGATDDVFDLYLPGKDLSLGSVVSTISADFDQLGASDPANTFAWIGIGGGRKDNNAPQLDEIRFAGTSSDVLPIDLSPPVLVSTDPVDDSVNGNGVQQTATFDEEVIAGTGDIRIVNDTDAVTTTIAVTDPEVTISGNSLTITPAAPLDGGKNYHIEIDAGAVTNYAGTAYPGISDATTWNFTADGGPPSLASITDDTSPLPLLVNTSLTYTVTFDEAIAAGTVDTGDFGNGGTASITVDSVAPTGDPAVFEVVVTADSTGSLTLEIVSGAVITDLTSNALDTTFALPDDTTITVNNPVANAASLTNDFQRTIASQLNPNNTGDGEGRYFHVSVHPDNAGTGWYCANNPDPDDTPAPAGVRYFGGDVVAYKFLGNGGDGNVTATAGSGGEDTRITYTTADGGFDGFGQQQLRLWEDNDPGADLATGAGTGASGFNNNGNYGYRDWSGATGIVDISGLESGSVHIYYGSFNSAPTLKVTMKDSDNVGADIVINDAHSIADGGNGDSADNGEYYVAEIDFVTDGVYEVIEYEWASPNGRGLGTVLTGPEPLTDYGTWAEQFAPADLSDPDGDLDGDGLTNDDERLFGLDPTDPASQNPYTVGLDSGAGTFSFTRRDPALIGLATSIETSTDLQTWMADTGAVLSAGVTGPNGVQTVGVTLSPGLLSATKLFARVVQAELPPLLSEDFEGGDGGFTVATAQGTAWALGTPASSGPGGTVSEGNGGSANAWGTGLGDGGGDPGQYADPTGTKLRSAIIDLTGVTSAELTFAEALDLEAGDTAVVNVIDDTTDAIIAAAIYTADDSGELAAADWNPVGPINLTPYVGQAIRLEWSFDGFGGSFDDYLGWYVDDVVVTGTP